MKVAIVIGLALVLVAASLAWIGGELHYRNCVDTARDRISFEDLRPSSEVDAEVLRLRRGCARLP
jgi:hypothetical protein